MKIIKIFKILVLMLMLIPFCNSYDTSIVFTGDSRTNDGGAYVSSSQLFSYLTTQNATTLYGSTYTGYNTGINGACLTNYSACSIKTPLVERIDEALTNYDSRFYFIYIGINDIGDSRLVPINELNSAYRYLLDTATQTINPSFIALMNSPDSSQNVNYNSAESILLNEQLNDLIYNLSVEYDTLFVNMGEVINDSIGTYTVDGIHYNTLGHQVVSNELTKVLKSPQNFSHTNNTYTNIKISIDATDNGKSYNITRSNIWETQSENYANYFTNSIDFSNLFGGMI